MLSAEGLCDLSLLLFSLDVEDGTGAVGLVQCPLNVQKFLQQLHALG